MPLCRQSRSEGSALVAELKASFEEQVGGIVCNVSRGSRDVLPVGGCLQRYDRSLFQRLEGAGQPTNMLSQQYRMHPTISRFASVSFYQGLLRDASHLPSGLWTPFPSWHCLPILQPLVFFNLDSEHTVRRPGLGVIGVNTPKSQGT